MKNLVDSTDDKVEELSQKVEQDDKQMAGREIIKV